ncbi:MAG: hypothetical protein ACIAQF_05800 [Phycisphaerales bacterium JB065]
MPPRLTTPLLLIAALTGPVVAQSTPDDDQPVVVDPAPRSGPSVPGNIVRQDLVPTGRGLIREGAFISEYQGLLRPLKGSGWAFVFDPAPSDDDSGEETRLKPMVVQPGLRLTEMQRLVEASDKPITFRVSGRVLVYSNRNYLLPTFYTTVAVGDREVIAPGVDERSDDPALEDFEDLFADTEAEPTLDESIEQLEQLDRPADVRVPRGPASEETGDGESDSETPARLIREGVQITARTGRLVRAPGGNWMMTFDNDTDPESMSSDGATLDTPMEVMPCLSLQAMETLAERYGPRLRFTVSGTVYIYDGRNYLLPSMYLIEIDRTGNLTPGQ